MSKKFIFKIYLWSVVYWSLPWLVMWRYKPGNFTTWKASPFVTFCPTIFALANTRGFIIFAVHICAIHWISIFFKMLRFSNKKKFERNFIFISKFFQIYPNHLKNTCWCVNGRFRKVLTFFKVLDSFFCTFIPWCFHGQNFVRKEVQTDGFLSKILTKPSVAPAIGVQSYLAAPRRLSVPLALPCQYLRKYVFLLKIQC